MKHVAAVDRGDHYHVVGVYSGHPLIAKMNGAEWQVHFAGSAFDEMRANGAVAMMAPRGGGLWLKDWSAPYTPPQPPKSADDLAREAKVSADKAIVDSLKSKIKNGTASVAELMQYLAARDHL